MAQTRIAVKSKVEVMDEITNAKLTKLLQFTYLYLVVRFKLKYRQISIITHTDFDGAISAAAVLQKYPYSRLYYASPKSLYRSLYVAKRESVPGIPHTIYILDIGIPQEFRTRIIKAIKDIRRGALIDITWIDHHRSIYLNEMEEFVNLIVDETAPYAADMVCKLVNPNPKARVFLDILRNANTPFVEYWGSVLKETVKSIYNITLRSGILRALANFSKTPFTDELYQRFKYRVSRPSGTVERLFRTNQGYKFALFPFQDGSELYPVVRQILKDLNLDFLLVEFKNGSFSAYKSRQSEVDLTPLLSLVGGKGHDYAFHFDPQRRITDEFFQPLSVGDLIKQVQEVL